MNNNRLILGVGNPLREDDGIGPAVIRRLFEIKRKKDIFLSTDLVDGGTDGLGLIEYLRNYKKVILIDAVEMGISPGSIKVFTPDEAILTINTDSLSTHGFGIAELITLARELDILPDMTIIGVQPETTGYGQILSSAVHTSIDKIYRIIQKEEYLQEKNKYTYILH